MQIMEGSTHTLPTEGSTHTRLAVGGINPHAASLASWRPMLLHPSMISETLTYSSTMMTYVKVSFTPECAVVDVHGAKKIDTKEKTRSISKQITMVIAMYCTHVQYMLYSEQTSAYPLGREGNGEPTTAQRHTEEEESTSNQC